MMMIFPPQRSRLKIVRAHFSVKSKLDNISVHVEAAQLSHCGAQNSHRHHEGSSPKPHACQDKSPWQKPQGQCPSLQMAAAPGDTSEQDRYLRTGQHWTHDADCRHSQVWPHGK
ncbi:uncharacterized protein LOC143274085 isoform X2 [Peromyscus maniculatus bairdii]|uniref:uncharacterized protein LOC143274085 isoform X2 n=1 Tax=Peromyscus maniculatus bairdii TaxID=230844 RepID=UPI003FD097BD